ncbi:MAG: hypothetical protein SVU32_03145, partial [Candidatus Nanohaloarchaea archaeon]|nr:hypothetical protein [Candidatus Nanohaloarchaea archaeon]
MSYSEEDIEYLAEALEKIGIERETLQNHADQVRTAYEEGYDDAAVILLNTFFESAVTEDAARKATEKRIREHYKFNEQADLDDDIVSPEYFVRNNADYTNILEDEEERLPSLKDDLDNLRKKRNAYLQEFDPEEGPAVNLERLIDLYSSVLDRTSYDIEFDVEPTATQSPDRIDRDYIDRLSDDGLLLVADLYLYELAEREEFRRLAESGSADTTSRLFAQNPYELQYYEQGEPPVRVADSAVEEALSDRLEDEYLQGVAPGSDRLHNALSRLEGISPRSEIDTERADAETGKQSDFDHTPAAQQPFTGADVERRLQSNAWNQMATGRDDMVHRISYFNPDRYPRQQEVAERVDALFGMEEDEWKNN